MYARRIGQTLSLRASGYYEEEIGSSSPYNNDRLDDAVSVDYSQAIGVTNQTPRLSSGIYASKIIQNSVKSQNERPFLSSGHYESRIGNSLRLTTSTPENTFQRNSMADNREREQFGNNQNQIVLDKTVHQSYRNQSYRDKHDVYPPPIPEDDIRLEGLESPRSTQWPETARSYPVGFEASTIADDGAYIPPTGESTDQISLDRRKSKTKPKRKESKREEQEEKTEFETPQWADRLLTKESSLLGKFSNIRSAINRWTLRQKTRLRPTRRLVSQDWPNQSSNTNDLCLIKDTAEFDVFTSPAQQETGSTTSLLENNKRRPKTNNVASILCGLSLIVIFVFPVIPIIVIYTDRSDLAKIQIRMKFNGTMNVNFDESGMTYSLCYQMDSAFSSTGSFQSCGVTSFRNGSIEADISLIFSPSSIPNNKSVMDTINSHFTNLLVFRNYAYQHNSIKVLDHTFIKSRLIEPLSYIRGITTTNIAETTKAMDLTTEAVTITEEVTSQKKLTTSKLEETSTADVTTSILADILSTTRETAYRTETETQTTDKATLSSQAITTVDTISRSSKADDISTMSTAHVLDSTSEEVTTILQVTETTSVSASTMTVTESLNTSTTNT